MWDKPRLDSVGEIWRPSNGTEGDIFMSTVCRDCTIGCTNCLIIDASMMYQVDEPHYPKQLHIGDCGYPQRSDRNVEPPTKADLAYTKWQESRTTTGGAS